LRVLIVGKTKMGTNSVCVGGWDLDNNTSVRLLNPGGRNHAHNTPFHVGDVWDLVYHTRDDLRPPHNEDVIVTSARLIGPQANLTDTLRGLTNPNGGCIERLFQGFLQFPGPGRTGFLTRQTGVPTFSTQFWISDSRFVRDDYGTKIRYRYEGATHRNITYKGMNDNPDLIIPQGALVRFSLARWHPFGDDPELKCYLQLSGWFV